MTLLSMARLITTIPDDSVEEDDEIVEFGGRAVLAAITEVLRGLGYQVSEPVYAGAQGWQAVVSTERRKFFVQSQHIHTWCLLVSSDITGMWNKLFHKTAESYAEFLKKLNRGLGADSRFTSVEWFDQSGDPFDESQAGTPEPVIQRV